MSSVDDDTGFFGEGSSATAVDAKAEEDSPSEESAMDEEEEDSAEESDSFPALVKEYVTVDNMILKLKEDNKKVRIRLRELGTKKRQLAIVVAKIMEDQDIDSIETEIDGNAIGKITRVASKRKKPTVKAINKTLMDVVFKGDEAKYSTFMDTALKQCDAPVPTLRRTRAKN